jgi:DNA-binding NarL/FixJ family response regulator
VTDSDYNARASQHRPSDPAALATEIRRMHADGLTSRDIAEALRLSHAQVIMILYGEPLHARITEHR